MIFPFASASYWQTQIHLVRFPVHPTGKPLWGGGLACFPSGSHWEITTRGSGFPVVPTGKSTVNWFPSGSHWEIHWELVSQWLPVGNPLGAGFPVAPTYSLKTASKYPQNSFKIASK